MENCAKCGVKNEKGVAFCGGCGQKFVASKRRRKYWKYVVGAIVAYIVVYDTGYFIYQHIFAGGQSSPSSQTALISAPNITPSTGEARKTSAPAQQACSNLLDLNIHWSDHIMLGASEPCVSFVIKAVSSPQLYIASGTRYLITSSNNASFQVYAYNSGAGGTTNFNVYDEDVSHGGDIEVWPEDDNTGHDAVFTIAVIK